MGCTPKLGGVQVQNRILTGPLGLAALGLLSLAAADQVFAQQAPARRVAVVIGVSQYPQLGPELALPGAYAEATQLAAALRNDAKFDDVRVLVDGQATRGAIEALFRDDLARSVGYNDLLLVYFVGHGMGGDFDDPYLLPYDARADDIPGSSLSVASLGADLRRWVQPRTFWLVTDASHKGSYGGLALYGPAASQWPDMGPSSLLVSATGLREAGADGSFGRHFLDAITGGADADDNHTVTVGELQKYLVLAVPHVTRNTQNPAFAGRFETDLPLATGVVFKDTMPPGVGGTRVVQAPTAPPEDVPTHTVDKVKFVFHDMQQPQVKCREQEAVACEPLCYVRQVKAGSCEVSGMHGSRKLTGKVFVSTRGLIVCEPAGDRLQCRSTAWQGG